MQKFKTYSYEKLDVWKAARKLVIKVYKITARLPKEETYGLASQMRRAVVSVSNNTAEGTCRFSRKDQARFTEIAYGSLIELIGDTITCFDLNYITDDEYVNLRVDYDEISAMLQGLWNSQIKRYNSK